MSKESKNLSKKENLIILFDTCSILKGDAFASCMKSIISSCHTKNRIIILSSVLQELRYLANAVASTCREEACRALNELQVLEQAKVISVVGDPAVSEQADFSIIKYISINRFNRDSILVTTQDRQLAEDIAMLNNITSVSSLPTVYIRKIGHQGELVSPFTDYQKKDIAPNNARDVLKRFGISS
ncbi:MAG: hypothetical protein E7665_07190 [Ruminococcaceae bacterium]|nr:hypothetical protein [Oscillospiraceae bacterium]